MVYKLDLGLSIEDAVRRLGVEQLTNARKRLIAKKTETLGVHEARKNIKKCRSLLRLIRPSVSIKNFRLVNIRLRDIGRSLSGTRDIQAMAETVARIQVHYNIIGHDPVIENLLKLLRRKKRRAEKELGENSVSGIITDLEATVSIFETLRLKDKTCDRLLEGFGETYEQGRVNMEQAYGETDIEAFHEWRKFLQHYWRQLQILTPLWPEMMTVYAAHAEQMSGILGNHNDLSILIDFVEQHREQLDNVTEEDIGNFLKLCDDWRAGLRDQVKPFGMRAYAEPASSFVARLKIYWDMAKKED